LKRLTEISVRFIKSDYDNICSFLYVQGINTILEQDDMLIFYTPEILYPEIIKLLKASGVVPPDRINSKAFVNKNWNIEWEKTIEPVFIKDKIIVYPSWKKNEISKFKNRIKIQIDPKMSFGTGHNETTQLILELMCDYLTGREKYFLDFGCGTGVLAIAAVKLGIPKGVAIDTDADSIENAGEYLKENKVFSKIKLYKSSIESVKEKNFDVIFANIISSVIKESMPDIISRLKKNGKLFLSGILIEEESQIKALLKKFGFRVVEIKHKAEWIGVFAGKN
jgi:ribosomal protein L11 methyltransferase